MFILCVIEIHFDCSLCVGIICVFVNLCLCDLVFMFKLLLLRLVFSPCILVLDSLGIRRTGIVRTIRK